MAALRLTRFTRLARVAALAAAASTPRGAIAQAVTPLPLRQGEIEFAVKASLVNDFVGRVSVARAEYTGTTLGSVRGVAEARVADMRTGIGLRDRHLRNSMHAAHFPIIRFDLLGMDPSPPRGDTIPVVFRGYLTVAGVTATINAPGWVVLRPGSVELQATFPVDMREHSVVPPSRFLGAVRVDPITQVTVRMSFGTN